MWRHILAGFLILEVLLPINASQASPVPKNSEILKILEKRIKEQKQGVGIVVGVIEPTGRRIVAYGQFSRSDLRKVDGDTVFEIGSVTKVFTTLLLADMVGRKTVKLSDSIGKYLPKEITVPQHDGKQITLVDLATHTSGLPGMPDNFSPKDHDNPFTDYGAKQLYEYLSNYRLTREIGVKSEYSNLGFGLLGHILAKNAGADYEALVRKRIAAPLDMSSTVITLSPELRAKFASGHNFALDVIPNWDFGVLAGAGAVRSTANDLLNFLEAALGYRSSTLDTAFTQMLAVRRPTDNKKTEVALGWGVEQFGEDEMIAHAGRTGGYSSFVGYLSKARVGVVVLSNSAGADGIGDIGVHLINSKSPLATPPKQRTTVTVDPQIYNGYVGRYQMAPDEVFVVTQEGDRLFVQPTGQRRVEIFPESETKYFLKVIDAQITFVADKSGRATSLILRQDGQDTPAPRMREE